MMQIGGVTNLTSNPQGAEVSRARSAEVERAGGTAPLGDSVTVSAEARHMLREQRELKELKEKQQARLSLGEDIREQIRQAQEQGDAQGKAMDDMGKCMQIASRIMSGDIVPHGDEQFLLEKNGELYMRAVSMRMEKEDPKEYDRLTEEEEAQGGAAASTAAAGSPEVAAPEAVALDAGGGAVQPPVA